jgi:hypothetical protein
MRALVEVAVYAGLKFDINGNGNIVSLDKAWYK